MEIDPRLHTDRRESSSEGTESDGEYPDPSAQSSAQRLSSSILNPYTQSAHAHQHLHAHPYASSASAHPYQPSSLPFRASPVHDNPLNQNDPNADAKRPRACESCRSLKVRCEPDPNPDEPCKRCAKAGRSCIVTVPSRKRQKKTDSRVTELERKIDVLTASLHASQKVNALLPSNNSAQAPAPSPPAREEGIGRRWLVPGQSQGQSGSGSGMSDHSRPARPAPGATGNKRHYSGELKDSRGRDTTHSTSSQASNPSPASENTDNTGRQWPAPWTNWSNSTPKPAPREPKQTAQGPDLIDRGVVSPSVASNAFNRYVESMCHHIPMVVFPPGTQMSEVRKHRPVLFHAVVAVAVGPFESSAQAPLLLELYRTIGERVIVNGEKSLDLVQGLLVACLFYTPPENFEEIKFYQLAQLAVAVGMDIGMYRKASSKGKPFNLIRELAKQPAITDPDSPEVRRAWLGCYFVSVQTSSALRRPILVRWLPYMDECVEILENSPDALPSDRKMVHWAKLGRIIENISARFFADDLGGLTFTEAKAQFTLKAFERQLEQWRREALTYRDPAIMTQAQAIVNIYLHENAMVLDTATSSEENKLTDGNISSPIAAARISALSSTLSSIHEAIGTICTISVRELISMPTVTLARTAFSVVALIKLYSIVSAPDSYIGQVIDPAALKVEGYLDKVIAHYTTAGSLPGGITPGKFSTVMSMLREWFKSRKNQGGEMKGAAMQNPAHENIEAQQRREQRQASGSTPLHLLSEVATGDNQSNQPQHQQYQQQPYASRPPYQPSPDSSTTTNTNSLPQSLAPCISPSDLPAQLSTTTPLTSANASTTTAPSQTQAQNQETWPPTHYDPSRHQYYAPTQNPFSPNQTHPSSSTSATGPGYDFSPSTSNMLDPSTSTSLPMNMNMPMGMNMGVLPDLGLGLDEQFWSTMGVGGDIVFWPQEGGWPF
ncbi:putative C6 transcription factor (War1) [Aspergillus undulatus]|uniref:putative C6 transcription factor (War1) n=1 Tax=Aspergillus undulatus TaxID=1810928 RepID=UPI003CCDCFC7